MPEAIQNKKNLVLVVDDEDSIRKLLRIALEDDGYKVEEVDCGAKAVRVCPSIQPDLVIMDIDLPDMDGKTVIETLREWYNGPLIVCSAEDEDKTMIDALRQGADDYITQPFNPDLMLARVAANLRQAAIKEAGEPEIVNGHIRIDLVRHEIFLDGESSFFTPKEYELLHYFIVNRGKMLTRKQILKDVWGPAHAEDMQYLRVYVSQLRDKIESDPANPAYIITEPGVGYRMEILDEPPVAA